jgi:hypothetical protein
MDRLRNLNRRFYIYGAILLVAVVALLWSEGVFTRTSEECKPVRDLLEFNQEQTRLIEEKGEDFAIADYERWADGMAERAGRVTDPAYAADAVRVAEAANRFVIKLPDMRAQTNIHPDSQQPTPPIVYEMSALNAQISAGIQRLTAACPD